MTTEQQKETSLSKIQSFDELENIAINSTGYVVNTTQLISTGTVWIDPYYWPTYREYVYQPYCVSVASESKVEQSFKIVQKLMEKKFVELKTAKQFADLVNEIAQVI